MSAQLADPMRQSRDEVGDVRIHSFISSFKYDDIANATHIIESKNKLVAYRRTISRSLRKTIQSIC